MKYKQRVLEKIVLEICNKNNITCNFYSNGWVIEISKNNLNYFICGYHFPVNNTTSSRVCDDKSACSDILSKHKINNFKHFYFSDDFYNEKELFNLFNKLNNNVVVKPNFGTTGIDVYHVTNKSDLIAKSKLILSKHHFLAISPFYKYEQEYRIIMNNNEPIIVYEKIRQKGQWKHNIDLGAKIKVVNEQKLINDLSLFAKEVVKTLNINFCSVDIAYYNNSFYVVEVNSGVMMESLSKQDNKLYQLVYKTYEKVILSCFE